MRRLLQNGGAEVIHLGHNRSVNSIVTAAMQEDATAIAISSYQGGHVEFFKYVMHQLRAVGCSQIRVFGGGGGTITPAEARDLEAAGVTKIYSPDDGLRLGLQGMIDDMGPGQSGHMTLNLKAGTYMLFCNVPGHYAMGQHTMFKVTG